MDLGDLLGKVVKESLGLRSKRHDAVASWLLRGVRKHPGLAAGAAVGAAGLAYAAWERSQRGQGATGSVPPPPLPPAAAPPAPWPSSPATPDSARGVASPPPLPGAAPASPEEPSLRQIRLVLAAAQADGAVTAAEMQRVMDAARAAGAEAEILSDLATPRDPASIVSGAMDARERQDLHALAFAIVRCDEGVNDAERRWLDRLAAALSLSPEEAAALEAEVSAGIDGRAGA